MSMIGLTKLILQNFSKPRKAFLQYYCAKNMQHSTAKAVNRLIQISINKGSGKYYLILITYISIFF